MIDGNKRHRRNGDKGQARQKWYAFWRSLRFAVRFIITGFLTPYKPPSV